MSFKILVVFQKNMYLFSILCIFLPKFDFWAKWDFYKIEGCLNNKMGFLQNRRMFK